MKKNFFKILKTILLGIVLTSGISFLSADSFIHPSKNPLSDNIISAPINTSSAPQAKGGSVLAVTPPLLDIQGTLSAERLTILQSSIVDKIKLSQFQGTTKRAVCMGGDDRLTECPTFIPKKLSVTVSGTGSGSVISNPQGINCPSSTCSYDFNSGTEVSLVATANSSSFSGWSGSCSGTNTICTFTINADTTVGAVFGTPTIPTVQLNSFTYIAQNGAVASGTVIGDGGAFVAERGIDWAIAPNLPNGSKLISAGGGVGLGNYLISMTNLTPGTSYNVRTYAKNSVGTAYGTPIALNTLPGLPTITTNPVSGITQTTATSGGTIISSGGSSITKKGVVWSIYQNPTISDSSTNNGTNNGNFSSNLSGLSSYTKYYVRAYATNSVGTGYGNEVSFTTSQISCGSNKVVAGYCWYLNPTQNQNCNTFCATRGGCKSASLTYTQETQVCAALGMGSPGGGSGLITPNTDGGWCYVQGTASNPGPFSNTTCSSSLAWRKNACSCNQ